MNNVQLIGRITRDIKVEYTRNTQTACVDNVIAVPRDKDKTDFIGFKVFGKQAENLEKYSGKGLRIALNGKIEVDSYEKDGEKKWITKVIADRIEYLDFKKKEENDFAAIDEKLPF